MPPVPRPVQLSGRILRPSDVLLRRPWLLVAAVAGAVLLTGLAAVAHEQLLWVDRPVARVLHRDELVGTLRWVTEGGAPTSAVIVSLVGLLLLWRFCRAFALALPGATLAGVAADVGLKVLVGRPRPDFAVIGTSLGSFPSGHVIQVTVAFGLLAPALYLVTGSRQVFRFALGLFGAMVVGVAASRVALGAHWPTDALGGFLIGAVILLGAELLVSSRWAARHCRACRLHESPEDPPASRPSSGR